jgi:hypothetical protein
MTTIAEKVAQVETNIGRAKRHIDEAHHTVQEFLQSVPYG